MATNTQYTTTTSSSLEVLEARIRGHTKAFDNLLRLIPPKYYIPEDTAVTNQKFMKHTQKVNKTSMKEAAKKTKDLKFDIDSRVGVKDIQAKQAEQEKVAKAEPASPGGEDDAKDKQDQIQSEDAGTEEKGEAAADASGGFTPMPKAASIDELRARLEARIQTLRQKRKAPDDDKSREAILQNRLNRKRVKKGKSKKEGGGVANEQIIAGIPTTAGYASNDKRQAGAKRAESIAEAISFGTVELGTEKRKAGMTTKQAIEHVEKKQKKLAELRATDAEKAKEVEEKDKWHGALDKARGVKVKDDLKKLKKTLKREQQQKKQSQKQWKERNIQLKRDQEERQKKRNENIQARIDAKKAKKVGKKAKSGGKKKARPGFEGKK